MSTLPSSSSMISFAGIMVQGKFGDVKTGCEADHVAAIALPARNAQHVAIN